MPPSRAVASSSLDKGSWALRASSISDRLIAGSLPAGTASIAAGMCVLGVTVYAFLTVTARALGAERYAALSAMWALVFLAGPGVFFPVEQEVSRAVASRLTVGIGIRPVIWRSTLFTGGLAIGLAALVAACRRPLLDQVFDGEELVLLGFVMSLFGYAALHLTRGVLAGSGKFRCYAAVLGAEGLLRLAAGGILVGLGVATVGPFALIVGITPLALAVVTAQGQRGSVTDGPPARWGELSRSLCLLLVGSLLAQVLIHAGPLAVKLLAEDRELTAQFFAGVLLTRVPLFLFFAVQAALLPRLTSLAAGEDRDGFSQTLYRLLAVVGTLGTASVAVTFLGGQQGVRLLFGTEFLLDRQGLALLAASTAAIMVAQTFGQALVALGGEAVTAMCWLAGVAGFVTISALGDDPLLRVELGLVTGSAITAVLMASAVLPRIRRMLPLDQGAMIDPPPFGASVGPEGYTP